MGEDAEELAELDRLRTLVGISSLAVEGLSIPELLQAACERVAETLGVPRVGVFERAPSDPSVLRLGPGTGWPPEKIGRLSTAAAELRGDRANGAHLRIGDESGTLVAMRLGRQPLEGALGAFTGDDQELSGREGAFLRAMATLLAKYIHRKRTEEALAASEARMKLAQQIGHLGSYDWDIATNTISWSDELFRIYGFEPSAFDPTYEGFLSRVHPEDRDRVSAVHQEALRSGAPYEVEERIVRPSGEVRDLRTNGVIVPDAERRPLRIFGICMDVTDQKRNETLVRGIEMARLLSKEALAINEHIVQGLCAIIYSLELHDGHALATARRTLSSARRLMNELLTKQAALCPGDLVRHAQPFPIPEPPFPPPKDEPAPTTRIVIADDSEDIRDLLQIILSRCEDLEIVGQATNGGEAVELCKRLQPDLLLLDLAMPVMDGLAALPLVRAQAGGTCVIVLSGFDGGRMRQPALDAGAAGYIEKGGGLTDLLERIRELQGSWRLEHPSALAPA